MNRTTALQQLKADKVFDLLVIGGGATGCGVTLDAATRGLDVALVERADFAQGTSSKSTKLVHGGVRYLEKAVLRADREQFSLVREGLRERGYLLQNAPHLAHSIELLTPVKSLKEAGYVFAGLVLYDILAGKLGLGRSKLLSKRKAMKRFPSLRSEDFAAAVTYYDGQFNDARMAVTLARTAANHGATCANHVEVIALYKEGERISGAKLRDTLTNEEWDIRAKGVVNATGPTADLVRRLDDSNAEDILKVSSGIHIMLDAEFTPSDLSLMIPSTEDGRVLFMIPWQGYVVFGTTDEPATVHHDPVAAEADVDYLLKYASKYLSRTVTRNDVRAVWSGLRPLVFEPGKGSTQELARTHVLNVSNSGLLTITGGKWTSYRRMAEETVDKANSVFGLQVKRPCVTQNLKLLGSRGFVPGAHAELARTFAVDPKLTKHLAELFGDEASQVLHLGRNENLMAQMHPDHPYIEAEIMFIIRNEMPAHATDILVRRLPVGLLDVSATLAMGQRTIELMGKELGWDNTRNQQELQDLQDFLKDWSVAGVS